MIISIIPDVASSVETIIVPVPVKAVISSVHSTVVKPVPVASPVIKPVMPYFGNIVVPEMIIIPWAVCLRW